MSTWMRAAIHGGATASTYKDLLVRADCGLWAVGCCGETQWGGSSAERVGSLSGAVNANSFHEDVPSYDHWGTLEIDVIDGVRVIPAYVAREVPAPRASGDRHIRLHTTMIRGEGPEVELDLMHAHVRGDPGGNVAAVVRERQRFLVGDPPAVEELVGD
jgi:hypothetical protein